MSITVVSASKALVTNIVMRSIGIVEKLLYFRAFILAEFLAPLSLDIYYGDTSFLSIRLF